jgi:hypothetical protein
MTSSINAHPMIAEPERSIAKAAALAAIRQGCRP